MSTDKELFDSTESVIKTMYPKFKLISKEKSRLHRMIGWILKTFKINPSYMDRYWTTIGATAAYPGKNIPYADWDTIMHEGNHAGQAKRWTSPIMGFFYLMGTPVMAILFFLLALPLFIISFFTVLPWWVVLIVFGSGLLFSIPVPFGYWRSAWEFEAYGFSIAIRYWTTGNVTDEHLQERAKQFYGPDYFYMYPYKKRAVEKLKAYREIAKKSEVFTSSKRYGDYYKGCYLVLKRYNKVVVD